MATLDYRPRRPRPPSEWSVDAARAAQALPLAYTMVPVSPFHAGAVWRAGMTLALLLAGGAALFLLRRCPRDVVGWVGLIAWGGFLALFALLW